MAEDINRRNGADRRQQTERRINADPDHTYEGPERRKNKDRRSGSDRRDKS